MTRELKDIDLGEVSLVDKAANKKKFLFFKQEDEKKIPKKLKKKINIVIDSDGTVGGTKIKINKEELKNLRDFSFNFWSGDDPLHIVSCYYSKVVETGDGFSRSETFHLSKGVIQMQAEIKKQLEEYFGENSEFDFEKAAENKDVVKALETINEYRTDFPDDLKKAIGTVSGQAGFCDTIVAKMLEKKEESNEAVVKKAGAKLSKETLKKLTEALSALKSILPQLTEKADKTEEKTDVEKMLETITKSVEGLEKNKEVKAEDELLKQLAELTKRLAVVEKGTGVKKGIEGQEGGDGDDNTEGQKWPSFGSKN